MNLNRLLQTQSVPLPEDILKRKWAGDFQGALRAIDARLEKDIAPLLRDRLTMERALIARLPIQYPYTKAEALAAIQKRIPGFTEAEFDRIDRDGGMDFIYVNGQPRYFESIPSTVIDWDRKYLALSGSDASGSRPILDDAIREMKQKGSLGYRVKFQVSYRVDDDAFVPGANYRVHLPLPKPCAQQSNIEITVQDGGYIAPETAPQRTVFYERILTENGPFTVSYAYDSRVHYVDLSACPDIVTPLYQGVPAPNAADLQELWPHIQFTPYLVELAKTVKGELTDKILIARACYDYVTTRVTYAYLRDYALIDCMTDYMALGLRGDCGAQTLLFMALCRLNGIPARWQSGTNARTDSTGAHDWCQIYLEPYGWVLCDVSFGGGAWHAGQMERWHFYFGNLDPFRMVANDRYMAEFDPPSRDLRSDPFDNQSGECEIDGKAIGSEQRTVRRGLELERLD